MIMKKRLLTALLILTLLFSFSPVTAFASGVTDADGETQDESTSWNVTGSKTASPTELSGDNTQTTVTLSLPEADYKAQADVVFLLDKSSSTDNEALIKSAKELVGKLAEKDNLSVKIGVVEFAENVTVKQDLVELTRDNADTLKAALDTKDSSGTNILGAVQKGEAMLASDTSLDNQDKYLIMLTDGGSTYYSDENGTPMHLCYDSGNDTVSIVSQYDTRLDYNGKYTAEQYAAYNKDSVQALIENGTLANGVQGDLNILGNVGHQYSDYENIDAWTFAKPEGGVYQTLWHKGNDAYITQLEKSFYLVGHELLQAKDSGYHILTVSWPYHPKQDNGASQTKLCDGFMDWIDEYIGSVYAYDGENSSQIFDSLQNELIYLVGSGTVTDTIGDKFDMVLPENGESPFTLTVGGVGLDSVKTGDNQWSFGQADSNGVYPYVVDYSSTGDEQFVWTINVPVDKTAGVQLSYNLNLNDTTQTATWPTNQSAVLDYTSSDGKTTGSMKFEIPQVTYTKTESATPDNPADTDTTGSESTVDTAVDSAASTTPGTGIHSSAFLPIAAVVLAISTGTVVFMIRKRKING
jgi:hypothetical protein